MIEVLLTPENPQLGDITLFDNQRVPSGWVKVTGQVLDLTEHPEIYKRIGKTYGYTDDHTFKLPDLNSAPLDPYGFSSYYIYMGSNA